MSDSRQDAEDIIITWLDETVGVAVSEHVDRADVTVLLERLLDRLELPNQAPADRRPWRTGNHWGVTVVAEGGGPVDADGRRLGDSLVAMARSEDWARQICDDHNEILRLRPWHLPEAGGEG